MSIIYKKRHCLYCKQERRMYKNNVFIICTRCNINLFFLSGYESNPVFRMHINLVKNDSMSLTYNYNDKKVYISFIYTPSYTNYGFPQHIDNVNSIDEFKKIIKKYRKYNKLEIFS